MRSFFTLSIVALSALAAQADQGSKLAEAQLQPASAAADFSWGTPNRPRDYTRPGFLLPEAPVPATAIAAPRAELPTPRLGVQPVLLAADAPLAGYRAEPVRPEAPPLAAGPLIRLQQLDVEATQPLPTLARPKLERASLADPTTPASLQATLMQPIPVRLNPEPFVPVNLPRPFEHRETVRLRQTPSEEPTPVVGAPRRP